MHACILEHSGTFWNFNSMHASGYEKLGQMGDRCDARSVIDLLLETASILVMR